MTPSTSLINNIVVKLFKYITVGILYLSAYNTLWAAPPQFTVQPMDKFVSCESENVLDSLQLWYQEAGGAMATSDSDVSITGSISFPMVVDNFNNSLGTLCGVTKAVTITFTATNEDGEQTISDPATFEFGDRKKPEITMGATSPTIACSAMARDSFINWIQTHGSAMAVDNCNEVVWKVFVWNDSEGNGGTSSTENGPYPPFVGGCTTFFKVSFIAEDICGNETATLSQFTIVDGENPTLDSLPPDLTVTCDQIPEPAELKVLDNCDPNPSYFYNQISTQVLDSTSCAFYNYEIERVYRGTDGCGNQVSHTQVITVIDTVAGILLSPDTLTVDCHKFEVDSLFAVFGGGCDDPTVSFSDSLLNTSTCETSYLRTHYLRDICDNRDTITQVLIVKDISGPTPINEVPDLNIDCSKASELSIFYDAWVDQIKNDSITEFCNDIKVAFATPGSYDVDDLQNAPNFQPSITQDSFCNGTEPGVLMEQRIDVIYFDSCGNYNIYESSFNLIDTIPPTIIECSEELSVTVENADCTAKLDVPKIIANDNCSDLWTSEPRLMYSYQLDGGFIQYNPEDDIEIDGLPLGNHTLTIRVTDCARNFSECKVGIVVEDNVAPEITNCPQDQTVNAGLECEVEYNLEHQIRVNDNCNLSAAYSYTTPDEGDEFLEFNTGGNDTTLVNRGYVFNDVASVYYSTGDAILTMSILAPLGTKFALFGEDDFLLGEESITDSCSTQIFTYTIPNNLLLDWIDDNRIEIAFVPEDNEVIPCGELSGGFDGQSFASFYIEYADAELTYTIQGATDISEMMYDPEGSNEVTLNIGENIVTYFVEDLAGNIDSCQQTLVVREADRPSAVCQDIIIQTPPTAGNVYTIDPSEIDNGSTDNCGVDTIYLSRNEFNCEDYGQEINVTLYVEDFSGNIDSCTARVRVEAPTLMPTYTSGICDSDTLKFFSNIPTADAGNYTYAWSGPNDFFSTVQNPIILNPTSNDNGIYYLTITGFGGCQASGSVQVTTDAVSTPTINASRDSVCVGDDLILNSTMYSGDVTYRWYEGNPPNGVLIATTTSPSTTISPTVGAHFYYVIVDGGLCESNPSNIIEIQSVEAPIAMVNDNFVNICEGDSFSVGTVSFGANYMYQWTGPNGFISNVPNPEPITDATANDGGQYVLIISNGGCSSDTAITRVNVFEKPVTPIITADDLFCESSTLTMSVNNTTDGDTYFWYLNGDLFTTTDQNSLSIDNAQENLAGNWQVQVEDGICRSDTSAIKEISISNLEEVTATNTGPACVGDTIQLFATFITNATYVWTGPDGFTSTEQNPKILAVAGEYSVEVSTSGDCIVSASTTVNVATAPTITALSSDAESCMNGSDVITFFPTIVPMNETYTYEWSGPNGFTSDERNPTITNLTESKTGVYQLQVSAGSCFSEAFSVNVQFTITPSAGNITVEGNGCEGDTLTFFAEAGDGFTYQWTTPSGVFTTDDPSLEVTPLMSSDEGYYSVARVNGSCVSMNSDSLLIEVGEPPVFPVIESNSPVCQGDTLNLIIQEQAGYTYEWKLEDEVISSSNDLSIINVSQELLDKLTLRIFDGSCTSPFYAIENIEIIDSVDPAQVEEAAYEFCGGNNLSAEICIQNEDYIEGATYQLFNANDELVASGEDRCFLLTDATFLTTNTYYVTAQIGDCVSTRSDNFSITFSTPELEANILTDDVTICEDELIAFFSEYGPPDVNVQWSSDDENLAFANVDQRITRVSGFTQDVTEIYLFYSTATCQNYSADTVLVRKGLAPEVNADNYIVGDGQNSINMDLFINDTITGEYTLTITDDPNGGTLVIGDNGVVTYNVNDGFQGIDNFTYEVCLDRCMLCAETTVTITVERDIIECIVPTIITPNGDGKNDAFVVPCASSPSVVLTLEVFNEWGKQVYSSDNYNNDWYGTYNGQDLPVGTYFFVLRGDALGEPINGFLIIQR